MPEMMIPTEEAWPLDFGGPNLPFEPFPEAAENGSVGDRFEAMARRFPDRLAIRDGDVSLSYAELARLVDLVASACAVVGPAPGIVAVLLPHGYRFVASVLGVMAAGHVCVPLDWEHPTQRNRRIALHAGATAVVSAGEAAAQARELFQGSLPVIDLDRLEPGSGPKRPRAGPDDLACILYTSGSSGAPKGVVQNHRGAIHNVLERVNTAHIGPDDRLALFYSPAVIAGLGMMLIALLSGASLEVFSPIRLGAVALTRALRDSGATLVNCSPTLFRHIVDALEPDQRLDSLRLVTLGGERVDWGHVDAFRRGCRPGALMSVHLGGTEVWGLHSQWFVDETIRAQSPLLPVGRAMPGRRVSLIGDDGLAVPEGEVGEVVVASRHLALGYWREPELTAAVFGQAADDASVRTFRTGDLARQRPDGLREFIGRKDQQIKLRGYRIEPGEIESALRSCPGVADATVVVRRSVSGAARTLAAYVQLEPDTEGLRPRHLMAMLSQRVLAHMMPAAIIIMDTLPWLPNFKIDRQRLEQIDAERMAMPATPPDPLIAKVADVFNRTLGIAGATADDNLMSLGGDSLNATEIALELKTRFGLDVDAGHFESARSIAEWAERIAARRQR